RAAGRQATRRQRVQGRPRAPHGRARAAARGRNGMKPPSIGAPVERIDARKKVTGKADYAADIPVAKVAHAVIVTSGVSRGTITALDVTAARRAPGVIDVITHATAPHVEAGPKNKDKPRPNERHLQLLQDDA